MRRYFFILNRMSQTIRKSRIIPPTTPPITGPATLFLRGVISESNVGALEGCTVTVVARMALSNRLDLAMLASTLLTGDANPGLMTRVRPAIRL